jgi:hypothetical protein
MKHLAVNFLGLHPVASVTMTYLGVPSIATMFSIAVKSDEHIYLLHLLVLSLDSIIMTIT